MDGSQDKFFSLYAGSSDDKIPSQEIAAYWAGEGVDADNRIAEAWIEEHAEIANVLRKAWDLSAYRRAPADLDRAWNAFQNRERVTGNPCQHPATQAKTHPMLGGVFKRQPLRQSMWYMTAIAVIGVLGLVIGWQGGAHMLIAHPPLAVSTYVTKNGERAAITLVDGTTVSLGVGSRLDVPADFGVANRTVHLTGEGLFTVSRRDGVPFIVTAGRATARVLGTTFLVRHYPTDSMATVAVAEGRVAVGPTVVAARQLVRTGQHGNSVVQSAPDGAFSFASGKLSLENMRLSDAIPELDRWFDVDVRLGDPTLARQYIKGDFSAGSVADLANILELSFDVRVVRDGRVLTLFARSPK